MAAVRQSLRNLPLDERRLLEAWLDEFEAGWHPGRLTEHTARLPSPGHRMRLLLLAEMVKVDLERQWRAGQRPSLESYLARFPELGTAGTVDAALVQAECDALLSAGEPIDWAALARRFPRQAALVRNAPAEKTPAAPRSRAAAVPADTHSTAAATHSHADAGQMAGDLPEHFGRYRIIKKLGTGGMGTVYQATDTQLGRQVAIKVPRVASDDMGEWIARFYREAGAAANFHHSNLCPVYDVGEIDGVHYLTMAYVDGQTLAKVIAGAKDESQSGKQVAVLVRTIALALAEAHRGGIIHRDLKPANIMIDRRGEPIVMDFGLARRARADESRLTATGALLGTPAYMPPEQALNDSDALGPACDIYSLGVILYELLCGRLPFEGPIVAVVGQILTVEPEPPSRRRAGVDPALEAICLKAMAKKPSARYASMDEFAAALTQYLRGGASAPRPIPVGMCTQLPPRVAKDQTAPLIAISPTLRERGGGTRPRGASAGLERARRMWTDAAGWKRWAITAAVAGVLLLGVVILVRTPRGTVEIALSDPSAPVKLVVDGDRIDVGGLDKPLSLLVGEHNLTVTGDGFKTITRTFTVTNGKNAPVTVELTPTVVEPDDHDLAEPEPMPSAPNLAPSVEIVSVEPEAPEAGGSLTIRLAGRDPEADAIGFEYKMGASDDWQIAANGRVLLAELKPGELNVQVRARDSGGRISQVTTLTCDVRAAAPPEAPLPANAPFSAEQAKKYQAEWAAHLKQPTVETNSIGMKLVLIPPGEFMMGANDGEQGAREDEKPRHVVRITEPFYLGVYEVTQEEYQHVTGEEPSWFCRTGDGADVVANLDTRRYPVEEVSWTMADEFCRKISALSAEKAAAHVYRLPTEAEWEYACRAGTTTPFNFGRVLDDTQANCDGIFPYGTMDTGDNLERTTAVGSYQPNAWGLFDLHGNVIEWCADWYSNDYYARSPPRDDPQGPSAGSVRVVRGGCWIGGADLCRSAWRSPIDSAPQGDMINGFRVVLGVTNGTNVPQKVELQPKETTASAEQEDSVPDKPEPSTTPDAPVRLTIARAPFSATAAKQYQERCAAALNAETVITNSIGMKLVLIPPGEFMMGAEDGEEGAEGDEKPRHLVRVTKSFYMGVCEVMQADYQEVMNGNPSWFSKQRNRKLFQGIDTQRLPVEQVSWTMADGFCTKLSAYPAEKAAGHIYRLPTEAEWEYACRAGTTTVFNFGGVLDGSQANCAGNHPYGTRNKGAWLMKTTAVGSYQPNAWGLFDMHGNVMEWCADWYSKDYYARSPLPADPLGPAAGSVRVIRGGGLDADPVYCRSANRDSASPAYCGNMLGFRVVCDVTKATNAPRNGRGGGF